MNVAFRLAAALLAALAVTHAPAADIVKAADIVGALSKVPKAVQMADGRWLQRDPSIDLQVQFEFDKSSLTPLGERQLDELASAFRQPALATFAFEVAGHTDQVGNAAYNQKLSSDRASATRDYLIRKHGIATERMVARGYGFERLADALRPGAAINRRVEIRRLPAGPDQPRAPLPAAAQAGPAPYALPPSGGTLTVRP
ncbi:OmpA family protein [Massilia yuzhufengensis]|uniref:OmpA family protein n=1 Tax=Massilia yuzhufengensis TaxID=1164594 RepID=A0A1I1E9R4_9BURK|nr:OmpA family protein [Massilia yuzhufengensis]SFB83322.1 OmpA family protein [Massilia yuzhufengensis]